MSLNFFTLSGDDDNIGDDGDISTQTTQPCPAPSPNPAPDREFIVSVITSAQASYNQRNCVLCKMVHEIQTGMYAPEITEDNLCDAHWTRFSALWRTQEDATAVRLALAGVLQHAKDRNRWPPADTDLS